MAQAWPQATVPPPRAPLSRPEDQVASLHALSILSRVSPPGAARLRQKRHPSQPQTGPGCSLLFSGSRSQPLLVSTLQLSDLGLLHTHTQDGNLHSDRGLLVAGSSESRTDVSREHSQTALFTGQGLSHGPTKCKDTFRCTLTSNGPYNCWSSHISSTSAQYFPQRC